LTTIELRPAVNGTVSAIWREWRVVGPGPPGHSRQMAVLGSIKTVPNPGGCYFSPKLELRLDAEGQGGAFAVAPICKDEVLVGASPLPYPRPFLLLPRSPVPLSQNTRMII